ncbi:hypothetical protein [Nocardia sp. NPDC024068]|uniref:hypothetical protein n=1 Tax=Nocardia sp. NPDC024068 TaxID=3157197 RepID=UPI0033D4B22A
MSATTKSSKALAVAALSAAAFASPIVAAAQPKLPDSGDCSDIPEVRADDPTSYWECDESTNEYKRTHCPAGESAVSWMNEGVICLAPGE